MLLFFVVIVFLLVLEKLDQSNNSDNTKIEEASVYRINVQVGKGFIAQTKINTWNCTVSLSFEVETRLSQGCVMSSVLINIAIDWVLCRTVEDQRRGIRWTPFSTLEDLDFEDDVALLSHTRQKTDRLSMIESFEEQQYSTRPFYGSQANQIQ